jgi:hypothetical protein
LTRVIGFEAATLALNLGQLAVELSSRRGEVSTGNTGAQTFCDQTLAQIDARIATQHQTKDAETKSGAEDTGQGDAERVHV